MISAHGPFCGLFQIRRLSVTPLCGWIGEAGPGASYGDDGAGLDNDFTQRNTTIMTWNLMHVARMLKAQGGLPNQGNDRTAWKAGCRFGYENPEHRA